MIHQSDVLVIGSGLAGLCSALRLAEFGFAVNLLSKGMLQDSASYFAQGGIAAVQNEEDSFQLHIADTIRAGGGLCNPRIVRHVVNKGPDNIAWLTANGVCFTRDELQQTQPYHLTQEGGHSLRRVVHAEDSTGKYVGATLVDMVRDHPKIQVFEYQIAIDLITREKLGIANGNSCRGAYVLDIRANGVSTFAASTTILATGGAGKVYLYTSNPDTCTGDGIAMAWRAGCRVGNMEFIQFHPTCLYHPDAKSFLISEAVRGEGGQLILPDGSAFMHRYHPMADLAPRDIVARAIDQEMKAGGHDCVYLDLTMKPKDFIVKHFPSIYSRCLEFSIDISQLPIPVVPAAHYTCGGIVINSHGQTDLTGLYAIGECSFSGLHGANRLASNSLLECLVFAQSASLHLQKDMRHLQGTQMEEIPEWDATQVSEAEEQVVVAHNWNVLRQIMWDHVGIVRTDERLHRAEQWIDILYADMHAYYSQHVLNNDLIELRNLLEVAKLIVASAQLRRESRGLHYNKKYPVLTSSTGKNTILFPDNQAQEIP